MAFFLPKYPLQFDKYYFLRQQFFAAIEAAHFPDCETGY